MMATLLPLRIAVIFLFGVILVAARKNAARRFPKGFLLGTATSSYQIEGAWDKDGKSENVWDWWSHTYPDLIRDHSNGDVACDFYNKYNEDIKLLKNIGVDFFRFSLSWSRILPNGYPTEINQVGLQFYKNVIDKLLENGIEPLISIYHWDHPRIFEEMGGWTNELMVNWISDYARVVFKELGPKVKYFVTINEPIVLCELGYMSGEFGPGKKLGATAKYLCLQNILKAHATIYHMYDTEFRKTQNGQIGTALPCFGLFPKTPNDTAAVDTYFKFNCGLMAAPIFSTTGDYPEIVKNQIAENSKLAGFPRSMLPTLSPKWVQYIKNSADFFGLNHYTSRLVETVPREPGESWYDFSGVKESVDPSWPSATIKWLQIVPSGLRQVLNQIMTEYGNPPVYILENGVAVNDNVGVDDNDRISYLHSYMDEMLSAIHDDECNVKGYTVWSLMDNFEWAEGYTQRFGIVHVNFTDPDRPRTPKASMKWYKNVIQSRKLDRFSTSINSNDSDNPCVISA